jgi:hypothetical protein
MVKVTCFCCKKATATCIVKDNGFKTYPACLTCKKQIRVVEAKKIS